MIYIDIYIYIDYNSFIHRLCAITDILLSSLMKCVVLCPCQLCVIDKFCSICLRTVSGGEWRHAFCKAFPLQQVIFLCHLNFMET